VVRSFYYKIRPLIPLWLRWYLQRKVAARIDGFSSQPPWPIAESKTQNGSRGSDIRTTRFVLTHDVDTELGFHHMQDVCDIEHKLGFAGSWNIVPALYEIKKETLDDVRSAGAEIGVHDWNHDGKLFSNKKLFDERIDRINKVINVWSAKGFRAGMVFHNDEWIQALECEYDSSYYDTDPYQPLAGGCQRIVPFMLGHLVELPYTMPQDHTLFVAQATLKVPKELAGQNPQNQNAVNRAKTMTWIHNYVKRTNGSRDCGKHYLLKGIDIWKMKATWLVEHEGMVLMLTHPDYLCHPRLFQQIAKNQEPRAKARCLGWLAEDDMDIQEVRETGIVEERWFGSLLEQYAAFLNWFKRTYEGKYSHCLPMEIADWYRNNS
jgi:hypothetical protein